MFIYRWRWLILAAWVAVCVGLFVLVPPGDPAANERASFLPEDSDYRIAATRLAEHFPSSCGLSTAVIVFERPGEKLTTEDNAFINRIALEIRQPRPSGPPAQELAGLRVSAPGPIDLAIKAAQYAGSLHQSREMLGSILSGNMNKPRPANTLRNPMRSSRNTNGQAAIVRVSMPVDFITYRSSRIVQHIRDLLAEAPDRPDGLRVAVTGTGGYGHDYAKFVALSQKQTMLATIIAVIVILLLVYRAPLAAMVPLVAISIAAAIVVKSMNIAQNQGMCIGMAEKIFVFVLMYGAGIDYSLLLISRFREYLRSGRDTSAAAGAALAATRPAILASAATDALGIFMLIFSQFLIFKTTGPVVAVSLLVAMLAAITLVPALVGIFGKKLFWPLKPHRRDTTKHSRLRVWPIIAKTVTKRPAVVMIITLAILAIPISRAFNITWVYDALAGIDATYDRNIGNATAGVEIAKRHWPIGEVAPIQILIEADKPLTPKQWRKLSAGLNTKLPGIDGVQNIRDLTNPLGMNVELKNGTQAEKIIGDFAAGQYISPDRTSMRLEAVMGVSTMSNRAMQLAGTIRQATEAVIEQQGVSAKVYLGGATAQMMGIRNVTQGDFRRLVVLVLLVIFVIVFLLLRDVWMSAFMVALIGVSYLTTLGLCTWVFVWLFGSGGMDWKVQVFLFVVMAAVGVDYNIFLAARLAQEACHNPPR
ncbi:MAG: MMPL family transporter, partial [Phycisphaerae bacterium]|nr:MMPL family transporter [Phycisphaerae bacterium]